MIKQAFTREKAADFTREMWARLGMDPEDKSTWTKERINMPYTKLTPVDEFSPKVPSSPHLNLEPMLTCGEQRRC